MVENRANVHVKRARLGNESSFSDFLGHKDGDLDFTNNNSSQNGYHLDSFSGLYNAIWYKVIVRAMTSTPKIPKF
ncbi:hypothetical protein CMV_030037 [Castanea mollissima]|uniref:Uncharacterized protein n=1 Tax=Castanea mollissima TaxID=60419 RepID=A0A8J4VCT2_9ROSI|nr:hypothetical protein CMV_030037 [Castanea mollissima]